MSSWGWNAADFIRFYELLPQPHDGQPVRLEGFQRLIVREIFSDGRVELLVLIPKGQAKTTLMAALSIYHLLITRNANCYVGAADKIQADELYRFAAHFVDSEPELQQHLIVRRSTKEVRSRRDQGFLKVLASDDSKQGGKRQGFNPTLALLDELHAHENDKLYTDMRSGLFKRHGLLVTITTAGWDLEGVLGRLRASFLEADQNGGSVERFQVATDDGSYHRSPLGRLTVARKSHRTVMLEWALTKDDDWLDFEVVKLANPASWVTVDSLVDAAESLRPNVFKRYRCNLWTLAYESWLPEGAWDALYGPAVPVVEHRLWNGASNAELDAYIASLYPKGSQIVGAVDMARYRDCAAVTTVGPSPSGLVLPRTTVWRSGGPDNPIPYEPVYRVARQLDVCYSLLALGLDQKYLDEMYDTLDGEGLPVESYPQSNERLCPADANLRNAILTDKSMEHDGDPILAAHVHAAIAGEVGAVGFKLSKSKSNGPPIDAARALSMAFDLAGDDLEPAVPLVDWGDA